MVMLHTLLLCLAAYTSHCLLLGTECWHWTYIVRYCIAQYNSWWCCSSWSPWLWVSPAKSPAKYRKRALIVSQGFAVISSFLDLMSSIASVFMLVATSLSNFCCQLDFSLEPGVWAWMGALCRKKKGSGSVALIGKKTSLPPPWIIHWLAYGMERKAQWSLPVCLCALLIASVAHNVLNWARCCSSLPWFLHNFRLTFNIFNQPR